MIVLLTLVCSLSMAQEPVEQAYPIDYGAVQEQAQQMRTAIDAIEFFLQDKKDFEEHCPTVKWEQPCLDDYKAEVKSHLPEDCLPEEEKKARAESKAVEP